MTIPTYYNHAVNNNISIILQQFSHYFPTLRHNQITSQKAVVYCKGIGVLHGGGGKTEYWPVCLGDLLGEKGGDWPLPPRYRRPRHDIAEKRACVQHGCQGPLLQLASIRSRGLPLSIWQWSPHFSAKVPKSAYILFQRHHQSNWCTAYIHLLDFSIDHPIHGKQLNYLTPNFYLLF